MTSGGRGLYYAQETSCYSDQWEANAEHALEPPAPNSPDGIRMELGRFLNSFLLLGRLIL